MDHLCDTSNDHVAYCGRTRNKEFSIRYFTFGLEQCRVAESDVVAY